MRILILAMLMTVVAPAFAQTSVKPKPVVPKAQTVAADKPSSKELTGVWKGQFFSDGRRTKGSVYKYEVQFVQKGNGALKGVTYSWQNDVGFYGKANGSGIFMTNANTLVLKETELEEVKLAGNSYGCLMTCYLDFTTEGNKQVLTGTYTSVESNNPKRDCGNGTLRLEKVPDSDFGIEPYVLERLQQIQKEEKLAVAKPAARPKTTVAVAPKKTVAKTTAKPTVRKPASTVTKPAVTATVTPKAPVAPQNPVPLEKPHPEVAKPVVKALPPAIFNQRKTQVEKTYVISQPTATISFYDMGDIDGDEISVYLDNKLVLNKTKLTARANSITLNLSEDNPVQEITVVAESLGSIPPNTAFVVIEAGASRYEVTLTSNMEKNARVLVEYRPKTSGK